MLEEALNKYTEAINLKIKDKINSFLYSNRAWVNLKLEKIGAALDDANHAIKWDPDNIKGYYRRGLANLALLKYEDALIDLEYAFKKYPEEKNVKDKIEEIKFEIEKKKLRNSNIANDDNENINEEPPEVLLDLKYIENEIKKEEEKIKNEYLSQNSKIIKNDNEKEKTIKEWINPNKKIKFTLLYRMSRDGENATDFHRNCDNKGATLTLAETTKGYQIGGYTTLDWESDNNGKNKTDDLTFLFSLNQMKKYTKKNNSRSIYVYKNDGPGFGNGRDLGIGNPKMTSGWSNNSTFLTNNELTNGEGSFTYKEVEVYKVDFN
jgi:tetratricopeptide (TPR) repeat protein